MPRPGAVPRMMTTPSHHSEAHVDLKHLLGEAWWLFAANPPLHVASALIVLVGTLVTCGLAGPALFVGYIRLIDRARRGEPAEAKEVLDGLASFSPAFITGVAQALGVAVGSIFVVLPGLAVGCATAYALWSVALDQQAPAAALTAAVRIARHSLPSLLLLLLVALILNV